MGQIGILARVADERSRLCRVKGATTCAIIAYDELVDVRVAARGKTGSTVGTASVTREIGSMTGVTDAPVLVDGSFVRYSDRLVVGGFSATSRKRRASGNDCRKADR